MLLTFALVVFFAAIIVVFSQEFTKMFKTLFAYQWTRLFIPLAFASLLVYTFQYWILWGVYYYQVIMKSILFFLGKLLPSNIIIESILVIIFLTVISVLPVILLSLLWKKRTFRAYPYLYITSTLIWIVSAILWLVFQVPA